jgi:16S rRNA (uracil1498-N3)-methyltransferase
MSPIFFANKFLSPNFLIIDDKKEFFHIIKVLRHKLGDKLTLRAPDNELYLTIISKIEKDKLILEIISKLTKDPEIKFELFLCQSLPKLDKWELILEKGTELGVCGFFPLQTERSIVNLDKKNLLKKYERWNRIIEEAVKQSGRRKIPELYSIQKIEELLENLKNNIEILVAWEKANKSLKEIVKDLGDKIYLFIGPEGSFSEREIDLLKENGGKFFNMGPRIFKVETAAIVASSLLLYEKGGLGLI